MRVSSVAAAPPGPAPAARLDFAAWAGAAVRLPERTRNAWARPDRCRVFLRTRFPLRFSTTASDDARNVREAYRVAGLTETSLRFPSTRRVRWRKIRGSGGAAGEA